MARCAGVKPDGTPCASIVKESQTYCYAHDPARSEQRRRAASKAGKTKTGGELAEVKAELKRISEGVLDGHIPTSRGSVAAQLLGVYLRAVEQERKQRELEEVEARLAELEQAASLASGGARGGRTWGR